MAERLAAFQHGALVQALALFVLAAKIHVALETFTATAIDPVVRNLINRAGVQLVYFIRVIRAI